MTVTSSDSRQGGDVRRAVGQAVIDLVRDCGDPEFGGGIEQALQFGLRNHGAGRIGGTGEQQTLERCAPMGLAQLRGRQVAGFAKGNLDHLDVQRLQYVAIGRIPGHGDRNPVAGVEHGDEGEIECRRGACGCDDPGRGHLDAVMVGVVLRDRLPQLGNAERVGVADAALHERGTGGVADHRRRRVGGLTDCQRDDVGAGGGKPIGFRQNVHGVERLGRTAPGNRYRHACLSHRVREPLAPHNCPIGMAITS